MTTLYANNIAGMRLLCFGLLASLCFCPAWAQDIVVSEYYNASQAAEEWTELLVIGNDVSLWNFTLLDNNQGQSAFQAGVRFRRHDLWRSMRAGTVILVYHRSGPPEDLDAADGMIAVSAENREYFEAVRANPNQALDWETIALSIGRAGDLLSLRDSMARHVHALGHKTTPGPDFNRLPAPKLNLPLGGFQNASLRVSPGAVLQDFSGGSRADRVWMSSRNVSPGLPNTGPDNDSANSGFWRALREPAWPAASLRLDLRPTLDSVRLEWTPAESFHPQDTCQGYVILVNTRDEFIAPADGMVYAVGATLGSARLIHSTGNGAGSHGFTHALRDTYRLACGASLYYRVYAWRFNADDRGSTHPARGRAYNQSAYASGVISLPAAADSSDFILADSLFAGTGYSNCPGQLRVSQTLRLYNTSTTGAVSYITEARMLSGNSAFAPSWPARMLPAGDSLPVVIEFTPASDGIYRDTLVLELAPCGIRKTVALSARSGRAVLRTAPAVADLGSLAPGQVRFAQFIYVNKGTLGLDITGFDGLRAPFEVYETQPALPLHLAPGDSLAVILRVRGHEGPVTSTSAVLRPVVPGPCRNSVDTALLRATLLNIPDKHSIVISAAIGSGSGTPGKAISLPVELDISAATNTRIDSLRLALLYDAGLLYPVAILTRPGFPGNARIREVQPGFASISIGVAGGDAELYQREQFMCAFNILDGGGDSTALDLEFDSVWYSGLNAVFLQTEDADFSIPDYCARSARRLETGAGLFVVSRLAYIEAGTIAVRFEQAGNVRIDMVIYNNLGRAVASPTIQGHALPGRSTVYLSIGNLANGAYHAVLRNGSFIQTVGFLVLN